MNAVAESLKKITIAPENELETTALEVRRNLESVVIVDHPSYLEAAEQLKVSAAMRRRIEEFFAPMRIAAHAAHKAICDRENVMLDGVVFTERKARLAISKYEQEQYRSRQQKIRGEQERQCAEQARLQKIADAENKLLLAEAQEYADDERLAMAVQIQEQGATPAEIEEVLAAPIVVRVPAYVAPMVAIAPQIPQFQRAAGLTAARKNWKGQVTDILELAAYVVEYPHFANLIQGNQPAINAMAKANEANLAIPGVRVYNDPTSVGVRR